MTKAKGKDTMIGQGVKKQSISFRSLMMNRRESRRKKLMVLGRKKQKIKVRVGSREGAPRFATRARI